MEVGDLDFYKMNHEDKKNLWARDTLHLEDVFILNNYANIHNNALNIDFNTKDIEEIEKHFGMSRKGMVLSLTNLSLKIS